MQDFTEELAMEWLRKPCWSIAESVYLLGEGQVPVSKYAGYPLPPEFAGNAGGGMDSLIRAIQARKLQAIASVEGSIRGRFPVYSPEDVIRVAEAINFGNWQNWKSRLEAIKGADIKQSKAKAPQGEIEQAGQTEQKHSTPPWVPIVHTLADEVYLKNRHMGCDPSILDIAKEVEQLCTARSITSVKGKRLSADNIKRHGLDSWKKPQI